MSNHRQPGAWMFFILLALALLCAITSHRRVLPFPDPDDELDYGANAYALDAYDDGEPYVGAHALGGGEEEEERDRIGEEGGSLLLSGSTDLGTSLSRIRAAMMRAHVQLLED